jgi:hypothetical protein
VEQHHIAALDLVAAPAPGERIPLALRVGAPREIADGVWECVVRLDGLYDDLVRMQGADSVQALCLALGLAATLLRTFVQSGGRLFYAVDGDDSPEDDAEWPMEAYFGSLGAFSDNGIA